MAKGNKFLHIADYKQAQHLMDKQLDTRFTELLTGFLVPADRFQGRVEEVEQCIAKHLDPSGQNDYYRDGIRRSLFNVTLEAGGGLTLYLFGHPITTLPGVEPCQRN